MHSNPASRKNQPTDVYENRAADNNAQNEGGALCLDLTEIAGGTTARGATIKDDQAVQTFVEKPSASNAIAFAGVAEKAMAAGEYQRHVVCGYNKVRVKNTSGATLALSVGTPLMIVPGQDYMEPHLNNIAAGGTTKVLSGGGGCPHAIVTVATSVAAGATSLVPCYVFMCAGPRYWQWSNTWKIGGSEPAAGPIMFAPGPGRISRAGLGAIDCKAVGTLELDVLINGTSIFTTKPKIVANNGNQRHTLDETDTVAATYLGAGGSFGLIDATQVDFVQGDRVSFTLTNASTWVGLGPNVQCDGLLF